jgi:peptidoglycan/LPS O-acetylase OafA/YrhL
MIRYAYDRTGVPVPALIVAAVAILIVAAWLVHRLIERPAAPALRRWIATGSIRPSQPQTSDDRGPRQRVV